MGLLVVRNDEEGLGTRRKSETWVTVIFLSSSETTPVERFAAPVQSFFVAIDDEKVAAPY